MWAVTLSSHCHLSCELLPLSLSLFVSSLILFTFFFHLFCLLLPLHHAIFYTLSRAHFLSLPSYSPPLFQISFSLVPSSPLLPFFSPRLSLFLYRGISEDMEPPPALTSFDTSASIPPYTTFLSLSPPINRSPSKGPEWGRQIVWSWMLILGDRHHMSHSHNHRATPLLLAKHSSTAKNCPWYKQKLYSTHQECKFVKEVHHFFFSLAHPNKTHSD